MYLAYTENDKSFDCGKWYITLLDQSSKIRKVTFIFPEKA